MQVQITEDDCLDALRLNLKPRPWVAVLGWLIAALVLLVLGLSTRAALQGRAQWDNLLSALAIAFLLTWYWLYLPWRVRRLYRQQRSLHEAFTVVLDADAGLRFESARGQGLLPWSHIGRWRESRSLFVLYESDALVHILPKRFFDETLSEDRLREALRQRVSA